MSYHHHHYHHNCKALVLIATTTIIIFIIYCWNIQLQAITFSCKSFDINIFNYHAIVIIITFIFEMHLQEGSSRNEATEEFKKRLEQSDRLISHARQEMSLTQQRKACQQLKLKRPSFYDHCSQQKWFILYIFC